MKEKIFEKFIELSFEEGVNNVSLSKLAASLGMSKPNLYTYFDSKDSLIFQMIDSRMSGKFEVLNSILKEKLSPTEKMKRVIFEIIKNYMDDNKYWVVFNQVIMTMILKSEEKFDSLKERKATVNQIFTQIIIEGIESGEFRDDIDPQVMASLVFGLLTPVLKKELCPFKDKKSNQDISDNVIKILFNGIKNRRNV